VRGHRLLQCPLLAPLRLPLHTPPALWILSALAFGIYVNFFTHHDLPDGAWALRVGRGAIRALLGALQGMACAPAHAAASGLALVALFIWLAANIGTFTAAWMYPSQRLGSC